MKKRIGSGGTRYAVVVLLLLAVAGGARSAAGDGEAVPHPARPARPSGPEPSPDKVREAMLTFYYYAALGRGLRVPQKKLRLLSLDEAAKILDSDSSPGKQDRKRLAIGKLLVAARPRTPGAPLVLERKQVLDAFTALKTPAGAVKILEGCLDEENPDPKARESCAYSALDSVRTSDGSDDPDGSAFQWSCCSCFEDCTVDQPSDQGPAKVTFTARVFRTPGELQPLLDPRTWTHCNPEYFDQSCYDAGTCDPSDGQCSLPEPGNTWKGTLAEQVKVKDPGGPTAETFANILNIETTTTTPPHDYYLKYGLCRSTGGKLLKDGGNACLDHRGTSGGTSYSVLGAEKTLQIRDNDQNVWLRIALEYMADYIVRISACCDAAGPASCSNCGTATCLLAVKSSTVPQAPPCQIP